MYNGTSLYRAGRDKKQEGSFQNVTAVNCFAVQYGDTQRNEDARTEEIHNTLVK